MVCLWGLLERAYLYPKDIYSCPRPQILPRRSAIPWSACDQQFFHVVSQYGRRSIFQIVFCVLFVQRPNTMTERENIPKHQTPSSVFIFSTCSGKATYIVA
jgi:hypothetical protein